MTDTTDAQDLVRLAKSIGVCTTLAKLIAIGDATAFSDLTKRIDEAVIAFPKAAATIARLQGESEAAEDYQQECHKLRVENIRLQGEIGGMVELLKTVLPVIDFHRGDRLVDELRAKVRAALTHSADGGRGGMSGDDPVWRRFGPGFEKPCVNPQVIECALFECQQANECQYPFRHARPTPKDTET